MVSPGIAVIDILHLKLGIEKCLSGLMKLAQDVDGIFKGQCEVAREPDSRVVFYQTNNHFLLPTASLKTGIQISGERRSA